MSLLAAARTLPLTAPAKPVLRELAFLADEAGEPRVNPSLAELGAAVGCSESTARRAIQDLVGLGYVERLERPGARTLYVVLPRLRTLGVERARDPLDQPGAVRQDQAPPVAPDWSRW